MGVFFPQYIYKWAKQGFATKTWNQKDSQSIEWKNTDSLVRKNFLAEKSLKKVMLALFRDMKGPITIDFLEKVQMYFFTTLGKTYIIYCMNLVYVYVSVCVGVNAFI